MLRHALFCLAQSSAGAGGASAAQVVRAWLQRLTSSSLLRVLPVRLRARFYHDSAASLGPPQGGGQPQRPPAEIAAALVQSPARVLSWALRRAAADGLLSQADVTAVRVAYVCEQLARPAGGLPDFVRDCHPHLQHFSAAGISSPQLIRCLAAALRSCAGEGDSGWFLKLSFLGGYFAVCPPPAGGRVGIGCCSLDVVRSAVALAALGTPAGRGWDLFHRVRHCLAAVTSPQPVVEKLAAAMPHSPSLQPIFDVAGNWMLATACGWRVRDDLALEFPFDAYQRAHDAFLDGRPVAGRCIFADSASVTSFWPDLPNDAKIHAAVCHVAGGGGGGVAGGEAGGAFELLMQQGMVLAALHPDVSIPACVSLGVPWRVADIVSLPAAFPRRRRKGDPLECLAVVGTILGCVEGGSAGWCSSEGRLLAAADAILCADRSCCQRAAASSRPSPPATHYDPGTAERVLALALRTGSFSLLSLWRRRRPTTTDTAAAAGAAAARVPVRLWEPLLLGGELSLLRQVVLCGGVPADFCHFASACVQRYRGAAAGAGALEACRTVLGPLWSDRELALQGLAAFSAEHKRLREARHRKRLDRDLHMVWSELEQGYLRALWLTGPSRAPRGDGTGTGTGGGPSYKHVQASVRQGLAGFIAEAQEAHATAPPLLQPQPQQQRPAGYWPELVVGMVRADVEAATRQLGLQLEPHFAASTTSTSAAAAGSKRRKPPSAQLLGSSLQQVVNEFNRAAHAVARAPHSAFASDMASFLSQRSLAQVLLRPCNGACGRDADLRARCTEALAGPIQAWELRRHRCPQVAMLWRLVACCARQPAPQ
ncbi:hypothetical protein HYH02_010275 [Chlamydomonas schloesseri]|uniref:Uncharacterized protein n=1 Tax=Chlamydomonas schloesseri TaxID=2026947 RepID=A0A835TK96_9CHLO|nr:hypothetical protein HYH02_010275 [Chlamydomonas schloesseri]|eukprot:KAG2440385.1 hypothetical protein HYH02_010275 [Chlamydomonas schloesseri]